MHMLKNTKGLYLQDELNYRLKYTLTISHTSLALSRAFAQSSNSTHTAARS